MNRGQARVAVAVAGMLLAVAGVALGNRTVVWVAIGVLSVAFVLRFFMAPATRVDERDAHHP